MQVSEAQQQNDSAERSPERAVHSALLAWYDENARILPWRAPPASTERKNPYTIWLAEIMLQQTTVAAAIPYFRRFCACWPDVEALGAADLNAVLAQWAGLGYYARARNMHACARAVCKDHMGAFPQTVAALRVLPGIGAYTSAAIAAIAFDAPVLPVDANIARILARLYGVDMPLAKAKGRLDILAARLAPQSRAGDFAQGLMDLGASLCSPKAPRCALCPLRTLCVAARLGAPERYPAPKAKAQKPGRTAFAYVVLREDGACLLRPRPLRGLLAGMMEVPITDFTPDEVAASSQDAAACKSHEKIMLCSALGEELCALAGNSWRELVPVRHVFTHFALTVRVFVTTLKPDAPDVLGTFRFYARNEVAALAVPSLMRKILAQVEAQALNAHPQARLAMGKS